MIPDPLNAFYEECRTAPVPPALTVPPMPQPWWVRLSVPAVGLSIGGLVALLLISMPGAPSSKSASDAAQAIALMQMQNGKYPLALLMSVQKGEGAGGEGSGAPQAPGAAGNSSGHEGLHGARQGDLRLAGLAMEHPKFERSGTLTPNPSPFSHETSKRARGA
jgi:hypothetical protein